MAKRKLRVGIDVDGVLRDFDTKAMEIIKELYPDKVLSDITHGWDFPNVDVPVKELAKIWQETHCEEIYRESELMPGVKEEFKILKDWGRTQNPGFQWVCVTAQMPIKPITLCFGLGNTFSIF